MIALHVVHMFARFLMQLSFVLRSLVFSNSRPIETYGEKNACSAGSGAEGAVGIGRAGNSRTTERMGANQGAGLWRLSQRFVGQRGDMAGHSISENTGT